MCQLSAAARTMKHLSTAFLIIALAIVVNESGATVQYDSNTDQVAEEAKSPAVTIVDNKYVKPETLTPAKANQSRPLELSTLRPSSKPPINLTPDKQKFFYEIPQLPQHFYGQLNNLPPGRHIFTNQPVKVHPNSVYNFPKVIPLQNSRAFYGKATRQPLIFPVSTNKPIVKPTSPKFSLPVQTINGIRADFVRPPKFTNITTTTTPVPNVSTTPRILRTKRIWPKRILEKMNVNGTTVHNNTEATNSTVSNKIDHETSGTRNHYRFAHTEKPLTTTTTPEPTTRKYRRVTRGPSKKVTTPATANFTKIEANDWVPIIPSHYNKPRRTQQSHISRRLDGILNNPYDISYKKINQEAASTRNLYRYANTESPLSSKIDISYKKINQEAASTRNLNRYASTEKPLSPKIATKPTNKKNRRLTRGQKYSAPITEFTKTDGNDWVPIVPPQYIRPRRNQQTPMNRRSDSFLDNPLDTASDKGTLFLQSYGLLPLGDSSPSPSTAALAGKKMVLFRKRKHPLNQESRPYLVSSPDLQQDGSHYHPKVQTKIKHHHHHHHHRYIKTVEKKVPYKVEVPKPYPVEKKVPVPVPVEKIKLVDRPYPVPVEKKVPYPVPIKVPHPIPVKVVEKEYVPKPYPIVHRVPVVQKVEVKVPHPVPVEVEKRVPYPVHVQVPVDRPVPVPVHVEKRVPYPVPVKVLVPQPYPVEKRVPYPVEVKVKEPVEVIKHVHHRVPYPQPYPVKVPEPVPVPVIKNVPYPVEVEKKVPVPYEVKVPQKVEVEKKIPVYVPQPYPVEKRVPYPVKVPYPVRVPVKVPVRVPVEIPVFIHQPYEVLNESDRNRLNDILSGQSLSNYDVTSSPQHSATVHGNTGFTGFQSRSDTENLEATETTTIASTEASSVTN